MKNENFPGAARALMLTAVIAVGIAGTIAAGAVQAQGYPAKPIHLVVPWPPGGNVDITARTIAPALGEALGQQVVVDNRAGAGGTIGTAAVAKSAPDGYTLVLGSSGTLTAAPAVYKTIPYDPLRDFTPIGPIQSVPIVLTAAPKTPVTTYAEFVALANAKNGALSIASAGNGSSNHLAIELLMRTAHLKLNHIPYKGSGPAISDLLGSQVETMMDQLTASIGHIKEGRIKALAITSKTRSPLLPNVPTLAELGVTGYEASTWTGIFGPAGLPPAVVDRLQAALRKAMSVESVRERYKAMGVELMDMSQPDFTAYFRSDFEKWRALAKEGNIVIQ